LTTQDNLVTIMQQQGRFLAPLPADAGMQRQLEERGWTNTVEDLLPRREASGEEVWSRRGSSPIDLGRSRRAAVSLRGTYLV
jgi:regulator of sirC expression with transglutaminase-like and TPR domain